MLDACMELYYTGPLYKGALEAVVATGSMAVALHPHKTGPHSTNCPRGNAPFFMEGVLPCLLAAGFFLMAFETFSGFCGMLCCCYCSCEKEPWRGLEADSGR